MTKRGNKDGILASVEERCPTDQCIQMLKQKPSLKEHPNRPVFLLFVALAGVGNSRVGTSGSETGVGFT